MRLKKKLERLTKLDQQINFKLTKMNANYLLCEMGIEKVNKLLENDKTDKKELESIRKTLKDQQQKYYNEMIDLVYYQNQNIVVISYLNNSLSFNDAFLNQQNNTKVYNDQIRELQDQEYEKDSKMM